jgi:hypothetical protein
MVDSSFVRVRRSHEDAGDLAGRLAFGASPPHVVLGRLRRGHAGDHDGVERLVRLSVEPVADGLGRRGLARSAPQRRAKAASQRSRRGVVTGGDEQLGGDVVTDPVPSYTYIDGGPGAARLIDGRITVRSSASSASRPATRRPSVRIVNSVE